MIFIAVVGLSLVLGLGRGPPCMHSRAFPGGTKNVTALHLVHQGKEKWGDKVLTMPAICEDLEPNEGSP